MWSENGSRPKQLITYAASTSGLLCRSTTWNGISNKQSSDQSIQTCEEKFSSVRAAVRVDLTAARYGLSTLD